MTCGVCSHPSECHELDGCRYMLADGSYPCKCEQSVDRDSLRGIELTPEVMAHSGSLEPVGSPCPECGKYAILMETLSGKQHLITCEHRGVAP